MIDHTCYFLKKLPKLKISFICLLICISSEITFAQLPATLSGILKDKDTQEVLPYVNIGVLHKDVGTVSDFDGKFALPIANCDEGDSIRISMLGYGVLNKTIRQMIEDLNNKRGIIEMTRTSVQLKEIKISSRELKEAEYGNFCDGSGITAGFVSNDLGGELVIKIKPRHFPAFVEGFNFYISKNIYDTLYFRLNVYKIENGLPRQSVLNHNIFIATKSKGGWVHVDLNKYNIAVEDDFAIGLEWIRDLRKEGNAKGLFFSAGFLNKNCYYRKTSQQEWNKISIVGLGFNVNVKD